MSFFCFRLTLEHSWVPFTISINNNKTSRPSHNGMQPVHHEPVPSNIFTMSVRCFIL